VATTYQYDAAGQVTRLILDNDDNPIDLDDRDFAYSYDSRGNRTKTVLNNDANKKIEYFYDDLNRLTKEQRSGTSTNYTYQYSYDAVGNRTQMVKDGTTTTYSYDNENRLATKTTSGVNTTYEYSYNGNLTKEYKDANNYRYFYWDSQDRLTKVEKKVSGNTTTVEYKYDAGGRRVQKVKGGDTTRYVYDGLKVAIEQVNNNNPLLYFNHFSAVGGMLARYDGSSEEAKISRVYACDVIGNVVGYLESDMPYAYGTGTSFVQEAFGNVLSGSQAGYHLTTKEYDPDSELYYFNARWYDAQIGRFLSKSLYPAYWEHPYIMSHNNPLYYIDPSGMITVTGGTAEQQALVQEAWYRACCTLEEVIWQDWFHAVIPPGADPRAVDRLANCMRDQCDADTQRIIIGGFWCRFGYEGYTRRPENPFGGPGSPIHICPIAIYPGVPRYPGGPPVPATNIDATLMHELAHTCRVGDRWAHPIGDIFR
jgi:RHS repeat-associated protein